MAREYVKDAGGTLTPIGGTQGVLVPAPARYCACQQSAAQPLAAGSNIIGNLAVSSGEDWIKNGDSIAAPVDGIYAVNLKILLDTTAVSGDFLIGLFNGRQGWTPQAYTLSTGNNRAGKVLACSAVCRMSRGDLVVGIVNVPNALTTMITDTPPILTVSLVEQTVHEIVAGKGALVSSPDPGKAAIDPVTGEILINPLNVWQDIPYTREAGITGGGILFRYNPLLNLLVFYLDNVTVTTFNSGMVIFTLTPPLPVTRNNHFIGSLTPFPPSTTVPRITLGMYIDNLGQVNIYNSTSLPNEGADTRYNGARIYAQGLIYVV